MTLKILPYLIVAILIQITIAEDEIDNDTIEYDRSKKQFSLFTIVSFPNDQCTAKSGSTTGVSYGQCLSTTECADNGGTVDGNCASGFGVCCTYKKTTCGSSVTKNCTYIQNPSYSSTYKTTGSCSYTLTPMNTDICQIRLDFDTFSTGIATTGICSDSFKVTGNTKGGNTTPDLCGTLTGQHLYVENGRLTTSVTIAFTIASTTGVSWNIKVSQIECSSRSKAPADCDQYFTGLSGIMKSYSFDGGVPIKYGRWTYCVRRELGYCKVAYAVNSGITSPDPFLVWTSVVKDGDDLAATPAGALTINNNDGLVSWYTQYFSDQIQKTTSAATDTVIIASAPFRLYHVTTSVTQAAVDGFNLQYNQIPCGTQTGTTYGHNADTA